MRAVENKLPNVGLVRTKDAEISDVEGMACCHIAAFPGRLMTEMGSRWLKGLYSYFIRHNEAVCLVAVDVSGKVLGFAVGGKPGIRGEFLHKAILRYPHIILWKFFTSSIVRKRLFGELFRKLRTGRSVFKAATLAPKTANPARCGTLVSIAVYPKYQGIGIAGQLAESFREASKERGYDILELYVFNSNARAIAFYKKHGWYEVSKHNSSTKFRLDLAGD